MRKILITAAASAALFLGASAANAYEVHFQTTSTIGSFNNGLTDVPDDTTAAFSFDASFSTLSDITIANGVFTDANTDLSGFPEHAVNFSATNVDLTASNEIDLINPDAAILDLTVFTLAPTVTGTYSFGGPESEQASGSFVGTISFVPLPATAPMFGAALLGLAAVGFASRRKAVAAL